MRYAVFFTMLMLFSVLPLVAIEAESSPVRQRDSMIEFTWEGAASTVEVSGEWDDWASRNNLSEMNNVWTISMNLDPGMYCYKLIIDDEWLFDPNQSYRGYCGGVENSIVRVSDYSQPMFTHQMNEDTLTVFWHAGSTGEGPLETPSALNASVWDATNWTWTLDISGFSNGKHTIHIEGVDASGIPADNLLLPFWIGEESDFIWEDALIYMVMTDRFVNGNQSNDPSEIQGVAQGADWMGGDLAGVTNMIQSGYFTNLGVNALWLTPFNEAANGSGLAADGVHEVSAYHGYWPVEPRSIDSRLGTPEELHELVDAAHAQGIRVMGDFVVNHVHQDHPYHTNHPDWFNQGCICGEENCDWTEHRLDCLFRDYMPDLNWKDRNASEQMIEDILWWIETYDLDGGRIDAVKHVDDLAITNLAVRINERFETAGTDIYLKGETAMGWSGHDLASNSEQYGTINRYIGPNSLDGQADFVLYHATSDRVFATGEEDYIHLDYWTARSQDQYVEGSVMVPFVGSHDVSRFSSRADPGTADEWNQWVEQGLPGQPGTDDPYRASLQAHGWLLTTPGAPMIYMGDEYGEYGGADPDNRHMWRDNQLLNERERNLQENISELGVLRSELESLRRGGYQSIFNSSDVVVYQRSTGSDSSLIALNRGATSTSIDIGNGFNDHSTVFGTGYLENGTNLLHISQHSVTVLTNETSYFESNITTPERDDGHCLIVENLTVNETLYVTLELTNICDKGINYPGVNATVNNQLVEGFPGIFEWYYLIFANSTYNYSWQLILNETIPNGSEIILTFEAAILNCGESEFFFHDCPNSILNYSFIVEWPEPEPGPEPEPEPEPVDTDGDGIPNTQDECPDYFGYSEHQGCAECLPSPELIPCPCGSSVGWEGMCTCSCGDDGMFEGHMDNGTFGTPWVGNESESEPEPTCIDGETRPAEDGCNDCFCTDGAWSCTEIACNPDTDDSSNDSDLESEESLISMSYAPLIGIGIIVGVIAILLLRSRESI